MTMPETYVTSESGPFAIIPLWVIERCEPQAIRLYGILAGRYADRQLVAYPSRSRLANDLGVTVRTVDAAIANLTDKGALAVTRRPAGPDGDHETNLYRVQRTAPGSVVEFPTLVQQASPPLVQPTAPEPDPLEPDPLNHTLEPEKPDGPFTSEFWSEIMAKWSDRYGGNEKVLSEIQRALNHKSMGRAVNKRRYIDNWLRRSLEFDAQHKSTQNGTVSREIETDPYKLAERENAWLLNSLK